MFVPLVIITLVVLRPFPVDFQRVPRTTPVKTNRVSYFLKR
jgi:hypothetical protein